MVCIYEGKWQVTNPEVKFRVQRGVNVGKKGEIYWTIFLFYFLILKNGNNFAETFCHICNFGPQNIFWSIKKLPPDKEVHHQFWAYFFLCGETVLK